MRLITAFVIAMVLSASPLLIAQDEQPPTERRSVTLRSTDQTKQFTSSFLNTMATGTTYEAFGMLKTANTTSDSDIDATRDRTQGMLDNLRATYGKPVGYDLLAEHTLGATIIRYDALLKLEKYAVRCTVTYYRATDTWVPVRVVFDEDVDALFTELGR
ncbi:MAG TPA: hypothetical protein VH518_12155 [Tepidisphaeraceae bacterium]|jgi:hypothetical protein